MGNFLLPLTTTTDVRMENFYDVENKSYSLAMNLLCIVKALPGEKRVEISEN